MTATLTGLAVLATVASALGWQCWRQQRRARQQAAQIDALNESLQNLLAAAHALPDGVVLLEKSPEAASADPDVAAPLRITACNRAAASHLGLTPEACAGRDVIALLDVPTFTAYARSRNWREPVMVRVGQHGEREPRQLLLRLVAYERKAEQTRKLLITRDVTQLERLETTRRDFVANVSHELRTPLTVLAGFLETLRDLPPGAVSADERAQYMTLMHEQAQRMQAIVADLLTLSTLESTPGSAAVPVGMAALIDTARTQAEKLSQTLADPLAETGVEAVAETPSNSRAEVESEAGSEAGSEVRADSASNPRHQFVWEIDAQLDVLGSESELASAIANLLGNAVHYTPAGGRITVRWRRCPDGSGDACYSVTDTGIGIDPQHLPRLTERFYRVDRSRSRAAGGTGLGLAITKHIAMRHDAELEIASQPGRGSTFTLRFARTRVVG